MLHHETVVCVSSIDWDFNWQGHQEVMATLASHGNVVLFIENTGIRVPTLKDLPRLMRRVANRWRHVGGIRNIREHLFVCSPVVLPFPYSRIASWVNRLLLYRTVTAWTRLVGSQRLILWTFLPNRITMDLINDLNPELVVYYCIADFEEVGPARKVRRYERQLLERADVVFAQGQVLAQRCRRYHKQDIGIFPFGVRPSLFKGAEANAMPEDLRRIPTPRVGYVGALQRHVDFALMQSLASRHPDWSLVLVGPRDEGGEELCRAPNVFWLGQQPHEALPNYIAHFDVCLIPYQLNAYTRTVYPTKLHEYLMLGKPVVSTPLPEVIPFSDGDGALVRIADTVEAFEACVADALAETDPTLAPRRRQVAQAQSWPVRIEAMSRIMEARLLAKRSVFSSQWSIALRRVLRQAYLRFLAWAAVGLCIYGLLFHTPLLWVAAGPLQVSQAPASADCIVVLAGGVGESGRSGEGYQERVKQAVELYRSGYAQRMIFSSGWTYAFREPEIMKALALSLGVPADAIVLEDRGGGTYQSVQHIHTMLAAEGWRSILLVTSPYHARRALLTMKKLTPDIAVVSVPIPHSLFYERISGANLSQIRGILHEYAAIVYYWLRGWI